MSGNDSLFETKSIQHVRATLERLPDFGAQTLNLALNAFDLDGFRL